MALGCDDEHCDYIIIDVINEAVFLVNPSGISDAIASGKGFGMACARAWVLHELTKEFGDLLERYGVAPLHPGNGGFRLVSEFQSVHVASD